MKQYSIDCDPTCGFMVRSHDKSETMDMARRHVKNAHNKDVPESEVNDMVKETSV